MGTDCKHYFGPRLAIRSRRRWGSSRRAQSRQPSRLGSFIDDKMLHFSINKALDY